MIKINLQELSKVVKNSLWVSFILVLASCGSASMDLANEEIITSSPGTGALVNGADGQTDNILSLEEFDIIFQAPRFNKNGTKISNAKFEKFL